MVTQPLGCLGTWGVVSRVAVSAVIFVGESTLDASDLVYTGAEVDLGLLVDAVLYDLWSVPPAIGISKILGLPSFDFIFHFYSGHRF